MCILLVRLTYVYHDAWFRKCKVYIFVYAIVARISHESSVHGYKSLKK